MIPIGFCLSTFGASYREVRDAALLIDSLGFDSVWLWDHYVSWNRPDEPVLDGLSTLAALAEATQHVKLGPLVANNTNRHPGRLAKIAATLHDISGGRFELGLGAGGLAYEQEQFGIDQGSNQERFARLKEAVQIIPALWRGQPVTFHGDYYRLTSAMCAPAVQPPPRLILGALGPGIARLAGRSADGLNLQWHSRERFPELLAALDTGLAESGRSRTGFDLSLHPHWRDLGPDPLASLANWSSLGFTRVMLMVTPPFPLSGFEALKRAMTA
ncbi:MAG: LLM class flavin-dependent oxidoreductase, partial [Chloroflexaceae bacterium]|jgi:alkanesulfonate monooxygenase SsuD/methylene tetrahydromethanopterin reductase-like flavin-dependent oxidoreductase (luciferase family)|nr:LLM class flavin-dependent oxidoreductase [Chloroflexaceae bacterium]